MLSPINQSAPGEVSRETSPGAEDRYKKIFRQNLLKAIKSYAQDSISGGNFSILARSSSSDAVAAPTFPTTIPAA